MTEIRITPTAQVIGIAVLLAALAAIIGSQMPEIQRYLKVKSM